MLKGITVYLYEKTEAGRDAMNMPVYEEQRIQVDNVLVGQPTEEEIFDLDNLTGRKAVYVLGIPKGDKHNWENAKVEFWGETFRTLGKPIKAIEAMVPMDWNQKVRVECYE